MANQYVSIGGAQLSYDTDGNLLSDGVQTYGWDACGRLTTVTSPLHTASYGFGVFDCRIFKAVDGVITRFLRPSPTMPEPSWPALHMARAARAARPMSRPCVTLDVAFDPESALCDNLLDTNVISELRKPKPQGGVMAWVRKIPEESLCIGSLAG